MAHQIEITDFHTKELEIYQKLNENQLRTYFEPQEGLFIAESPKVIRRALDAGYQPMSFLVESSHRNAEVLELLDACAEVPAYIASHELFVTLTGFALTRGALCAMYRKPLANPADLLGSARRIAVLENVENPTNVGAIFRSAAALGVDAVLLTPGCSDPLYRRASRVSMGTVFQVPWTFFPGSWPADGMALLHRHGFPTAAMALSDCSVSLAEPALAEVEKLAIVLGTEGDGLLPQTIASCDYTVRIPMTHGVDSLNVAAASAVAFWQLCRINL